MGWAKAVQPLVNTVTGLLAAITLFLVSQVYHDVDVLKKDQARHAARMDSHLEDSLYWKGEISQLRKESQKIEKLIITHTAASNPEIVRAMVEEISGLAALLREKQYRSEE
jgi:hypothetical protein